MHLRDALGPLGFASAGRPKGRRTVVGAPNRGQCSICSAVDGEPVCSLLSETATTMPSRLTPAQVADYRRDGYLLYREPVLPKGDFAALAAIYAEHRDARGSKRADELDTPHLADDRLLDYLLSDAMLDLVSPIIGDDIGLFSSHFIAKEPRTGRPTPWHEDGAYWNGKFDRFDDLVTVWLALEPSNRSNGCLRVIPGTHRNQEASVYEAIDAEANTFAEGISGVDESRAVDFELEPNQASLHHAKIIHGADANTSDTWRVGYAIRYYSQSMRYDPAKNPASHKLFHARGRNVAGNPVANAAPH